MADKRRSLGLCGPGGSANWDQRHRVIGTALPGQSTAPPTATVSTTLFSGGQAAGTLAFEPADPTACNEARVTTAGIQGVTTVATQS